eukprot:CAMPEP_0201209372 /NCGR_PEP_ID=MMETSP0851-20130426/178208_1 /ASSEMBLY_ACC=CAM_ASM_000631 /TAXON_ID=183588 /ORGANISM="Pseudo-nitzschia fraudulenta, Strain WWA7" /LENGTH=706 /DNA_ID=CAMNT_0047498025 /DNA_START=70 /DNA_END=2190 /DNA_ORIENTATION=-
MPSPWNRRGPQRSGFRFVVAATLSVVVTSASGTLAQEQECLAGGTCSNTEDVVDCGVYMAPSTVGDHSNLGIFTAKAMKNGDKVPYPEIIIPMLWRDFHNHPEQSLTDGQLWDRYIWEQYVGEIEAFEDLDRRKERAACFIPGVGCTVNSMLHLGNIRSAEGSEFDEVVERSSPGAGAFTPYHSAPTIISAPDGFEEGVDVGQELFATYGEHWIPWIPNVAVTYHKNFKAADELMGDFEDWIVEHEENPATRNDVSEELLEDIWNIMTDFPHVGPRQWEELTVLPKEWDRDRLKQLKHIKHQQKQFKDAPSESEETSSPLPLPNPPSTSTRYWADRGKVSLEFLREEGKCQDHIRPGISTISHAGRGAFATRNLPKGTVVGYSPLVHIAERGDELFEITYNGESEHGMERFEFRDIDDDEEEGMDEMIDEATGRENRYSKSDLVMNYSFGHRNSTLLLTPYGAMVNYINHKSSKDGDGPNVRVVWPNREMVAHKPEWLSKDLNFLRDSIDKIGLSFDYVALRDIKEGEEVTMDYGDEWDNAWKEHVTNWVPPDDAEDYLHSSQLKTEYLRTPEELREEAYPWNVQTLCTNFYTMHPGEDVFTYVSSFKNEGSTNLLPCRVMERTLKAVDQEDVGEDNQEEYLYTIAIQMSEHEVDIVQGYPHDNDGIQLYDIAYSPMWHLKEAFRHRLYIPDDIFPENWMAYQEPI